MLRRLFVLTVFAIAAVAALLATTGFGQVTDVRAEASSWMTMPDSVGDVAAGTTTAGPRVAAAVAGDGDHAAPCVVRADCAGAFVVGGLGLVLALPAAAPLVRAMARPTAGVVVPPSSLRSTLWASRLHRPPQSR